MSGTSPSRVFLTVVGPFGLGYYISYLYRTVNIVISGPMAEDLSLSPSELGLLTSVYFIVFAAFQTPLGIILDRFGPRLTQVYLLLIAVFGSVLFASSQDFVTLLIARGLIGLGVSGCLMAAIKANATWFPAERLPLINGVTVAFGSFGALSATVPVEWLFQSLGWRPIFYLLGIASLILVIVTWWFVPHKKAVDQHNVVGWKEQIKQLALVYGNPFFWRVSVVTFVHNAAFLAYQTLWMGPWLRDVGGLEPGPVAFTLLLFNIGMFVGVLSIGALAERLQSLGVKPEVVLGLGIFGSICVQLFFVFEFRPGIDILCFLFGYLGSASLLCYSVLTQNFPKHLTGRVNTAMNMLTFIGAFVAQWGIGMIINQWGVAANGNYDPQGHQVAFGLIVGCEIFAFLFFVFPRFDRAGKQ